MTKESSKLNAILAPDLTVIETGEKLFGNCAKGSSPNTLIISSIIIISILLFFASLVAAYIVYRKRCTGQAHLEDGCYGNKGVAGIIMTMTELEDKLENANNEDSNEASEHTPQINKTSPDHKTGAKSLLVSENKSEMSPEVNKSAPDVMVSNKASDEEDKETPDISEEKKIENISNVEENISEKVQKVTTPNVTKKIPEEDRNTPEKSESESELVKEMTMEVDKILKKTPETSEEQPEIS